MSVLIIAEHDNKQLKPAVLHAVTAAMQLSERPRLLIMGHDCDSVVSQARKLNAMSEIVQVEDKRLASPVAEDMISIIQKAMGEDCEAVVVAATSFGKNLLPRLAAVLDVGCYSDVTRIESADTFVRPVYAGNVLETVRALDAVKLLSVRTTAFDAVELGEASEVAVSNVNADFSEDSISVVTHQAFSESVRPELSDANRVVSGGRGLQNKENFKLVEQLADCLKAAVGASRAAVDAGFIGNDYQVGQTGKVVAPELYIALGISGAVQHLAGMKDSKIIVAINKDEDAPIFKIATYGLVGDVFQIVPELIQKLRG